MRSIVADKHVKFRHHRFNRFDPTSINVDLVAGDVISSVDLEYGDVDIRAKCGDSGLNSCRIIRLFS